MSRLVDRVLDAQTDLVRVLSVEWPGWLRPHAGTIRSAVPSAAPFGVSRTILPLVIEGGNQLPGEATLWPELVPATEGFVFFEAPLVPPIAFADGSESAPITALLWQQMIYQGDGYVPVPAGAVINTFAMEKGAIIENRTGVFVTFLSNRLVPTSFCMWPFGRSADFFEAPIHRLITGQEVPPPEQRDPAEKSIGLATGRRFLALLLFLDQKIVVPESRLGTRGVFRRAAAARLEKADQVRVIELRRSVERGAAGGSDFEYACRFLVRGHWRKQFYRSDGSHRPKWIASFLKGPEDAPLRVPKRIVFKVDR